MCGIAGLARSEGLDAGSETLVRRMCDAITHRGPDDDGYYTTRSAAIGIRRLSIIDLETGHQPVFNEDKTLAVILNGEIYNYRELYEQLTRRGHRFYTRGDAETIVHLYEDHGDDCVQHLRGMFTFALWDEPRQRLLIARDRLGIKPLFYRQRNGNLIFGSEIKCLLEDPEFTRRIRLRSLAEYLTYLYVPAPATMFEGVEELPAGHLLTWSQGSTVIRRYWQLRYHEARGNPENYYLETFAAKLADAVKSHLVSDVPLGAFLSGGIDSGTVVALMTEATGRPAETFTMGFEGEYGFYDERGEARLVAQKYGSRHHEFVVRPDVGQILPQILRAFDQPHADSSAIPNYYICELARKHVTVALSGLGGDELMGGYERYLGMLLGDRARKLPLALRRLLARATRSLPDVGGRGRFSAARLKRFAESAQFDAAEAYLGLISTFGSADLSRLLVGAARTELQPHGPADRMRASFQESGSTDRVNQMLFADSLQYLPGDLLPLTDRMSMAHSLEVRVPFLDHELVELAASIPPKYKIQGVSKKHLLRRVASRLLPKEIVQREKRGFSVPLAFWFREEL
ncbi:MAG: asparagine synthase (glutamine-hydrolyzing), partial [Acidobacteria bacterium]|nr:asparagine synthase (glutamine-hydrolyzing) [Acidobacteriota bacterium]